jgi:hypothetical protein
MELTGGSLVLDLIMWSSVACTLSLLALDADVVDVEVDNGVDSVPVGVPLSCFSMGMRGFALALCWLPPLGVEELDGGLGCPGEKSEPLEDAADAMVETTGREESSGRFPVGFLRRSTYVKYRGSANHVFTELY